MGSAWVPATTPDGTDYAVPNHSYSGGFMPKPQWGWFAVALAALVVGVYLAGTGWATNTSKEDPPGSLLLALVGLVAVWSFGKAFFNFRYPPKN